MHSITQTEQTPETEAVMNAIEMIKQLESACPVDCIVTLRPDGDFLQIRWTYRIKDEIYQYRECLEGMHLEDPYWSIELAHFRHSLNRTIRAHS